MSKIILDLDDRQIENIVESLSIEEKLKLVRKLEKETLRLRWDKLLKTINERIKSHPMSWQEIDKEIETARKKHYAKRCH